MDYQTLEYWQELMQTALLADESRASIEKFLAILRKQFVFDNVAVYLQDDSTQTLEVAYARAVGRAKSAEADAAWGESFAGEVLAKGKPLLQDPKPDTPSDERLHQAYLLGLPLRGDGLIKGALVFVRFGGPVYEKYHITLASIAAELLSLFFERAAWKETHSKLHDLKRQMQLQEDFVSTISHELRTPLGFIKGYSTSLLRQDTSWDESTQREFLMIIDEEADRLAQLIENVLESARLQSKTLQLRFQPLRLDAIIRDVAARIRARYKDIFENLFTNAVKYAPDSSISVILKKVGPAMLVSFTDQGPGIPQDSLPFIFERFYRVRSEKSVTGTGLGLYICKQIIDAHRGKIWAESLPGQGTTFFIELPINSSK
jgi:signal transduction histidine kinase